MAVGDVVNLERDCPAALVPMGTPVTLPEGSQIIITQELGGSVTANVNGNLVRIDQEEAYALGLTKPLEASDEKGEVESEQIWKALMSCYDPEIPINIVDLGLVYDMSFTVLEEGHYRVNVTMTLTAPGCGMGPFIVEDVRAKLMAIPGVQDAIVDMVFDPPWDRSMMSEAAKLELGMF